MTWTFGRKGIQSLEQCMMCSSHTIHSDDLDADGTYWTYCGPCDCWTEHAPDHEADVARSTSAISTEGSSDL